MANITVGQLVRYVKALDLPITTGIPSVGWMIYANGNELRRVAMDNIVSEIIRANFEIITQTTVVPSTGYRRYRVVDAGSYTMPDGDIIVTESQLRNNFVYIVVDEGVSSLELIPIGVESIIKDWDALEFGLEYPEIRYHNGSIYRVIEGQTTDANDPPGISAKWEVIVQDTNSFLQLINNNTNSIGNLGLLETTNTADLVSAINEVLTAISTSAQDLDSVALQGNTTSVKLVGSSLFENKTTNDFAQIGDIQNAIVGVNYFGSFDSLDDLELINGNVGDFATLNYGVEQYLYQITDAGWRAVNGLFAAGLKVKKRPNNLEFRIIQKHDFCEGWISPNLFVKGLWKGADNPSLLQLQNKDNWSNFIEIG